MLKTILEFFSKEKKYAVFLTIIIAFYAFYLTRKPEGFQKPVPQGSEALKKFEKAEKEFQAQIKDQSALRDYMKDHPVLAVLLNIFVFFIFGIFAAGVVLDILFWLRPSFRKKLDAGRAPPALSWGFSLIFKFFIWFFILNIALGFLLLIVRKIAGGGENFYVLLHTTMAEISSFLVIWGLVRGQKGTLASVGLWNPGNWKKEMRVGWISYAGVLPLFGLVLMLLILVTKLLNYEPPPHPLVPILLEEQGSVFLVVYSLFLACFMGPFFEEVFFRGFFYPILKEKIGKFWSMILTSAFFALIHESTFAFWPIFVLGLSLNYVYEKRGSLIAPLTLHITHNTIFLTYFFLAKQVIGIQAGV